MTEPYADSLEHLRGELARLDLLLQREVTAARLGGSDATPEEFRGLVITEPEIDALAHTRDYLDERWRQQAAAAETLEPFDQRARALREEIDRRQRLSRERGVHLALPLLAGRFELSRDEVDLLLVALAPELEPRYETLYAYLQNDVTRRRPSVDLALNLICRSQRDKLEARRLLSPAAPLLRHRLVQLGEESHDRQASLLRKFLKVDEALVAYVLEHPPGSPVVGVLLTPDRSGETSDMDAATRDRLTRLAASLGQTGTEDTVVRLVGQSAAALREAAEIVSATLGRRLLLLDLAELEGDEARLATVVRDAKLWDAVIAITASEMLEDDEKAGRRAQAEPRLWRGLETFGDLVLLLGPPATFLRIPPGAHAWRLELPGLSFALRRQAWERALAQRAADIDVGRLADSFHFGARHIRQTVGLATRLATLRDPDAPSPSTRDLFEAGRVLTTPELRRFAIRVEPRYAWTDIVLPPEKTQQLRRIATWMLYRHRVHEEWGFGEKLSRGKGLNVLFSGPSGTGKTMAAEILAGELSLDLYQIDLSTVVSKYIGETEKHLSAIFREAEESQAILFFDEADALFGKRTEVKDAHDRYANIEVNYLLQRVEQYEGIVILASNLQRNLDEAFLRRLHDVLEFPFPDEALRERIWRSHFPAKAWLDTDLDFEFLARQFKLTGGNIKNVALDAAFRAAEESKPIGMAHVIWSTKAELQKLGKLPVKADFDRYYELIRQKA